jgi:flagellar hook-associated protein 1 FlgK
LFQGLQSALTGIRAGQVGLDTATNNVANASTPGYTRQRVDLASRSPWQSVSGKIGQGVDVTSISRMREGFLDRRARVTGAAAGFATARSGLLTQTEALLGEPDAGIQQSMLGMFDAFDERMSARNGSFRYLVKWAMSRTDDCRLGSRRNDTGMIT